MLSLPAAATADGSVPADSAPGVHHTQVWFGPAERRLYGWLSMPREQQARGGVLLCPPMGEEARAVHRTFRRLAESLADAGLVALRFDYDGTGDSAGRQNDPDRVGSWLASVEAARAHLSDLGVVEVSAVGMRLGATLASCQAAEAGRFHSLVLWDPCLSGRTFLREGEALYSFGDQGGLYAFGDRDADATDGLHHTPGFQYDEATARALRHVDLSALPADRSLAARILLLSREDRPVPEAVAARVREDAGAAVIGPAWDQHQLLDLGPSNNFVPQRALQRVVEWLVEGAGASGEVLAPPPEHAVEMASDGPGSVAVTERSVRIGGFGLYGIADEPVPGPGTGTTPRPWIVLINVAAEHHVGPGRLWVELARKWAGMGFRCIRLDHSGIGDSPTHPGQLEGEPYAPEWIDDLRQVMADLGRDGSPVSLIGLCSGAYSALEAALWDAVAGVFAINPRSTLYPAAKGSPVYTDRRRAAVLPVRPIARLAHRHRVLAGGLWRIYRQFAWWHAPARVLRAVVRRGTTLWVVSYPMDAREFVEVVAMRPLLWWLRRDPRFVYEIDQVYDHSLLGRQGQLAAADRATAFVLEMHRSDRR